MKPLRFAVSSALAESRAEWLDKARRIEDLGYSALLVPDHFGNRVGPFAALGAAAAVTSELRLGIFVAANDFRHPAVLAAEAAMLDVVSDGRFELGIGAGWKGADYAATGIPFDPPAVRVERLREAVAIVKGLWGDGEFSFAGSHYRIDSLDGQPKPVQKPHPPLLLGGGGDRMLGFAGREANIVGVMRPAKPDGSGLDVSDTSEDWLAGRIERLRNAAGARFDELELNILGQRLEITDDVDAAAARVASEWDMSPEEVLRLPEVLIGDRARIADKLIGLRDDYGISYFTVAADVFEQFTPIVAETRRRE